MIYLFDIEAGIVKPTIHCSVIEWLKVIQEKYKEDSTKVYAYIYYMSYIGEQNPYFNIPEKDRQDIVIKDLGLKINPKDKVLLTAIENCKKMYTTPTTEFYNALRSVIENLTEYMKSAKVSGGKDGNLDEILKITKDYNNIRKSYKEVYNDMRDEENTRARGGQELAYDQQ